MYPISEPKYEFDKKTGEEIIINQDILYDKTIKDSKIYDHFTGENRSQKLVIYVNQIIPINETYKDGDYSQVNNHCVVATGLVEDSNGVWCLALENHGGDDQMKHIPLSFPLFEGVYHEICKIEHENSNDPTNIRKKLNKYGCEIAQKKWPSLKWSQNKKWYTEKNAHGEPKYQMFFVRGISPIFKLDFIY